MGAGNNALIACGREPQRACVDHDYFNALCSECRAINGYPKLVVQPAVEDTEGPMIHFNQLTPAEVERLAILSEELGEAQQAVGKIIRHGYESRSPFSELSDTNRDDLAKEVGDVQYAVNLLVENGDLFPMAISERVRLKAARIAPYLHHQKGTE